jgi:hypothetical protein
MAGIGAPEALALWAEQSALPALDAALEETHGRIGAYKVGARGVYQL